VLVEARQLCYFQNSIDSEKQSNLSSRRSTSSFMALKFLSQLWLSYLYELYDSKFFISTLRFMERNSIFAFTATSTKFHGEIFTPPRADQQNKNQYLNRIG
jgi:hypothetical protein